MRWHVHLSEQWSDYLNPASSQQEAITILSPTAILGYGFPEASFEAGMKRHPDAIAVDAGSSDPGPWYLGAGVPFTDRTAVKRDLRLMICAARKAGIPVIIGSAGGCGALPHLMETVSVIREIADEEQLRFRMAIIPADVSQAQVLHALQHDRVHAMPPGPDANADAVRCSTHIVGQMGIEPLMDALRDGADVIVAGRAYDPAVFAALPILRGFDPGLALHMGKILECAAIASVPGSGSDCMLSTLQRDHFTVETLNPDRRCTITSVAAHTLYEKTDPYALPGPGGVLDLRACSFEQPSDTVVRVSGSRFLPSEVSTIKLEGARPVGFRTVAIAGARDPVFIEKIDEIIDGVRARVADNFANLNQSDFRLGFHVYGKNGVMGTLEPETRTQPHELGIVIETVAGSQVLADTICSFARSTMLHFGFPGRLATAGNLAFPYSPSDLSAGQIFEFSLYHLMEIDDPRALFPIQLLQVP